MIDDKPVDSSIVKMFHTFDSNDPAASVAIAAFVLADIKIYKDGGTTQRTSTSGIVLLDTDGIDFDGQVGIGGYSIDLSDNDDVGFYAADSSYSVVIGPVTVDAAVINWVSYEFTIEIAGGAIALTKALVATVGAAGVGLTEAGGDGDHLTAIPEVALVTLVTTTTTNTDMRGTDSANTVVPPSVAQFNARTILSADYFDPAADAVAVVTLVTTTTTNTDMRGTDSANTVVPPSVAQFNARTILSADYFDPVADPVSVVTLVTTTTTNTDMRGTDSARLAATAIDVITIEGTDATDALLVAVDAGLDEAIPELTQTQPSATPSLRDAAQLQHMKLRNKYRTQTAGDDEMQIHNDAGTVIAKKALSDDGADYEETEMVSGP